MLVALAGAPAAAAASPVQALPPAHPPAVVEIAPGVGYQRLVRPGGQVVHVLRVARSPRLSLSPALTAGSTAARAPLAAAVAARADAGAVAGVNGDFFNYSTNDPSGVLMIGGDLVHEPEASRSALVMGTDGTLGTAVLSLQGRFQAIDPTGARRFAIRAFGGLNRAAKRGSETILYTPAYGRPATPVAGSRFEVRVRLDQPGPLAPNVARTGTVVATGSGGGMAIGADNVVLTGVGSSEVPLASELPVGQRIAITPGLLGLPSGADDALGGGPTLVAGGRPVTGFTEGFTASQLAPRSSRTAVGQTADGTDLLVTAEGPAQGSPGITGLEQAGLMASLGARTAIAMDSGGSAQMALTTGLVTPWPAARSLSTALLVNYSGVTLQPLPFRLSPNGDGVDDRTTAVMRAATPGTGRLTIAHRTGRPTRRLWEGRFGPGAVPVGIDPARLGLADGVYIVVADFTPDDGGAPTQQRRRVIIDRTLASLTARPQARRVGRRVVARIDVGFRLLRPARVTVRVLSADGRPRATIASGRPLRAGRRTIAWNRTASRAVVSGPVRISVEARTPFGITGLVRGLTLRPLPTPPPRPGRR